VKKRRIGITTTLPVEFIFSADALPVDLNNIFVTDINASGLVEDAEIDGLPRATCGWIKGMYGASKIGNLDGVIAVSDGDCSHTRSLLEILKSDGMEIYPFAYPYDRDKELLKKQMEKLAGKLGTTFDEAIIQMKRLDKIRAKLFEIDRLTWQENKVTGFENHLFQVSASDFDGDPDSFEEKCDRFIAEAKDRLELPQRLRLAYIGVPPIMGDLYNFFETKNARVVFNEVQRQFTFPFDTNDLLERHTLYTYPYDVFARIEDIKTQIEKRSIDGIVHYVQSFCHHQMEDLMFRRAFDSFPFLTIEGDSPQPLDARTKLRIESFCEMLTAKELQKSG